MTKAKKKYDVVIEGQWGLYGIDAASPRGQAWMKKHLSKGERTKRGETLMCEGGDRCREIVAGMDRDGLRVELNGVDMKGFGKSAT